MMLNNMVNNWSTEIKSFNINFVHISGKANVLADMLSRLIDTDPDLQQQPELEGHEFGKYCFETLPKVRGSTSEVKIGGEMAEVCEIQITYDNPKNLEFSVELPLEDDKFASLQGNDPKIRDLHDKVKEGEYNQFYFVKNNVLFRSIVENGHKFKVRVIPESLRGCCTPFGPQPIRTQWIPEDICCNQASVLLERNEDTSPTLLQNLQSMCSTKGSKDTV